MLEKLKNIVFSIPILALVISIPTFISLIKPGYFPMYDDIQVMRIFEMDKCFNDGQIPCRWVPDMGYGYGYPQFNYYAPLPYYIMEMFHLGGLGYLDSAKTGFILSFVVSVFGMFLLAKSLWGAWGGFLSAIFYAYLPYRAYDTYARGAVGELYAFAFLPFIFWAGREVILGRKKGILWLALSLAALLTSHNITGLIFIPFFIAWVIFLIFNEKLRVSPDAKKRILALVVGLGWGFGLSAFFTLPALIEKNLVQIETITSGYFNYLAHFVTFGQLFLSSYWGYATSQAGPWDETSFAIGILQWSVAILATAVAWILKSKRKIPQILFWVLAGFSAAFLANGRSSWIWSHISFATLVQFPWRFLILSGFSFSVAAGALGFFLSKGGKKWTYVWPIVIAVILFYSAIFRPQKWLDISDEDKLSGESWKLQQTLSLYDYLPVGVKKGPSVAAPQVPNIVSGRGEILNWEKGTDWQKGTIKVVEKAKIEFPIYNFPNWEVNASGKKLDIGHGGELDLVSVNLEPGEWNLEARLRNTPVRTFANVISFLALVIIPIYLWKK